MNLKHVEAIYNPKIVFDPEGFTKVNGLGKDTVKVAVISAKRKHRNYKRLIVQLGGNVMSRSGITNRVNLLFSILTKQLVIKPENEETGGLKIDKNRYLVKDISTKCILNDLGLFRSKEVEFKLIERGGVLIQL